jgi:UDP-N-acetylglucosamine 2-epimerase (non-hydrolysing)
MKRVLTILGTRPEAIKLAPVIREMENFPQEIQNIVVATAQHREIMDQALSIFNIQPDFDLNVMVQNQDLYHVTRKILEKLRSILTETNPDFVFVQGDTTTSFAGALAAFYEKLPTGHVEAGLRSHEKYSPFPEEMNRRLTDILCNYHYAPTQLARESLLREGISEENIIVTGNTAIDSLLMITKEQHHFVDSTLKEVTSNGRKLILVTAHRRESFNQPLKEICIALKDLVQAYSDIEIVYSLHFNPNIREPVREILGNSDRIHLIEPPDYKTFIHLMKNSFLIMTDSGGIQEEAPSLKKPVIILREVSDRMEGIHDGTAVLAGTKRENILKETTRLFDNAEDYQNMTKKKNPYGDGMASRRIVNDLRFRWGLTSNKIKDF